LCTLIVVLICLPLHDWAWINACVFVRICTTTGCYASKSGGHGRLLAAFWGAFLLPIKSEATVEFDLHIAHNLFEII